MRPSSVGKTLARVSACVQASWSPGEMAPACNPSAREAGRSLGFSGQPV